MTILCFEIITSDQAYKTMFLGGLHENGKYENCTGGITGYIDRVVFTNEHLYQHPTCQQVYGRKKRIRKIIFQKK